MNLYGYTRKSTKAIPIELKEVTLLLSISEIDEMISFMQQVKELHTNAEATSSEIVHTHFSDIIKKPTNGVDIIITTKNHN